jgi:carbon storage regulator
MLVISRKPGEKLRIGDNVELVVLEISGSRVVLGIDAPRDVSIRRTGPGAGAGDDEDAVNPEPVVTPQRSPEPLGEISHGPLPFQYPSRAVEDASTKPFKAPVVKVRRSRRLVVPPEGDAG